MPRKVLDPITDTTNWQKVQDYIEERVLQGRHGGLDLLLRDVSHPISQRPFLRLDKPFQIDPTCRNVLRPVSFEATLSNRHAITVKMDMVLFNNAFISKGIMILP